MGLELSERCADSIRDFGSATHDEVYRLLFYICTSLFISRESSQFFPLGQAFASNRLLETVERLLTVGLWTPRPIDTAIFLGLNRAADPKIKTLCLSKDPLPEISRPISLISYIGKMFTFMWLKPLTEAVAEKVGPIQGASRKGTGATEQAWSLMELAYEQLDKSDSDSKTHMWVSRFKYRINTAPAKFELGVTSKILSRTR